MKPETPPAARSSAHRMVRCYWEHDEFECSYKTDCGQCYCFEDGTPRENRYRFCPGCGKRIRTTRPAATGKEVTNET
jgi:hypothetical protein